MDIEDLDTQRPAENAGLAELESLHSSTQWNLVSLHCEQSHSQSAVFTPLGFDDSARDHVLGRSMELALPEENLSSFSAQQAALRLQRRLDFEWFGGDLEVARREGAVVVKDYEKILARTPEDLEVKGLRILTGLHHASALALLGGPENCDKARDELIRLMNLESDVRFSEQFQDVVEWAKFAKDPVFLRESAVAANMGCIESVLLISKLNHEQPKNPKPLLESLRKVLSLKPEMLRDERFTEFAKKLDAGRDKEFVAASARARAELEKRD